MSTNEASIESIVKNALIEREFNVVQEFFIEDYFNFDMIATRGGLTLIVQFVKDDILNFDAVAKLTTLSTILKQNYSPITIKIIIFTTSEIVSDYIYDYANNNKILIAKIKPNRDDIYKIIEDISYLKPMIKKETNVIKILEDELKDIGDIECLDLLNAVTKWYEKGGNKMITDNIKIEIDNLSKGGY